jgi:hypothetical protein
MNNMNITAAKYMANPNGGAVKTVKATIDGQELFLPLGDPANRHYAEIMRQVEAGTLTIEEAD